MENGKEQKISLKKKILIAGGTIAGLGLAYLVGKHGVKGSFNVIKDSTTSAAGKVKNMLTCKKQECECAEQPQVEEQEQRPQPQQHHNNHRHNRNRYWRTGSYDGGAHKVTNNN